MVHVAAARAREDELAVLSREVAAAAPSASRDLAGRPFADWDDALDFLAGQALREPLLLVLDELPDLLTHAPELPSVLRAFWDRMEPRTHLRLVLCGSAMRTMQALEEERAPLFGRFGLSLQVHPFAPHEAALMLPGLAPAERAVVWGLLGGVPLYLSWWDGDSDLSANLSRLVCTPGGRLLVEGELLLATEAGGPLSGPVLRAVATGHTKHNEIADAVRADPSRTLGRLVGLRLLERLVPVTDDPRRARRRVYRVTDNFLRFWLGLVDRYRSEIERGLGPTILPALVEGIDDLMGATWEEAFRLHLRRLAGTGALGDRVVAVGAWWREGGQDELDAVVLAGRSRSAVLVGEARWARRLDARRVEAGLLAKAAALPSVDPSLRLAVCAREEVHDPGPGTLVVRAESIFGEADPVLGR